MRSALRVTAAAAASMMLVVLGPSCAAFKPLPEVEGGVELGLRRGASWSTVKVRPPYIIGPRANLHIQKDVVRGTLDTLPVSLHLEPDGIDGTGPLGPVAVDITNAPDKLTIEGSWNGQHVHFEITSTSIRGSLAGVFVGRSMARGRPMYCQYVLDNVDSSGARTGSSICSGLPEETRLEIPSAVQTWLTRPELVLVFLALLSTPPVTSLELQ
jgi:hypothetical protein